VKIGGRPSRRDFVAGGVCVSLFARLVAADLREARVKGHDAESMSLGSVVTGPFVECESAFNVDFGALHQALGSGQCVRVERGAVDPLQRIRLQAASFGQLNTGMVPASASMLTEVPPRSTRPNSPTH
jgi:hypothetical protein